MFWIVHSPSLLWAGILTTAHQYHVQLVAAVTSWTRLCLAPTLTAIGLPLWEFLGIGSRITFTVHWERDSCNPACSSSLYKCSREILLGDVHPHWFMSPGRVICCFLFIHICSYATASKETQRLLVSGLKSFVPFSRPRPPHGACYGAAQTCRPRPGLGYPDLYNVCSMSTWDEDEFWEIFALKIGWVLGSHLLGNLSLYYETITCCDYISDKGNQRCCQIVSAEVFQHRRSSLCSSWLWLVFVTWLGHQDNSSCAIAHWRREVNTEAQVAQHGMCF